MLKCAQAHPPRCGKLNLSAIMQIPEHVIAEARVSLDSQVVRDYLAEICQAHGVNPELSPVYYSGLPLFVCRTLYAANEHARDGRPWCNPYPDPECSMLVEHLSAAERMQVRASPPHMRMEVALKIVEGKLLEDC